MKIERLLSIDENVLSTYAPHARHVVDLIATRFLKLEVVGSTPVSRS